MNLEKLRLQEQRFLVSYPGGFQDPSMAQIAKRHNISKFVKLVQEGLSLEAFQNPDQIEATVSKIIRGSSLVSVFEKTAYHNMQKEFNDRDKAELCESYRQLLHGSQGLGFELLTSFLRRYQNAKWPIITSVLYYSNPNVEILVKPTTVKQAIQYFELENLNYVTRPDYGFYCGYRDAILAMKQQACSELQVDNGAFGGFLMFAAGRFE